MTSKDFKKMLANVAKSPASGKTFLEILKEPEGVTFLRSLVDFGNWPARERDVELREVPEERRIVILIDAFSLAIDSGGIEQLVADASVGAYFDELLTCCKTIGAVSAVSYLERMANYFPEGKIPADESERIEMLATIKNRENIQNFRALNKEFTNSAAETIEALRRFIGKNPERFASVLSHPK